MEKASMFGLFHSGVYDEFFVTPADDVIPKFDKRKINEYYEQEDNFYSFNETHEELEKLPRAVLFHVDQALLGQYQEQLEAGTKTIDDIVLHRHDENGNSGGGSQESSKEPLFSLESVVPADGSDNESASDCPVATLEAEVLHVDNLNEESAEDDAESQAEAEAEILRLFRMTEQSAESLIKLRETLSSSNSSAVKLGSEEQDDVDQSDSEDDGPTVAEDQTSDGEGSPGDGPDTFDEKLDTLVNILMQLLHLVDMLIKLLTQLLQQVKMKGGGENAFHKHMKQQLARIVSMLTKSKGEVNGSCVCGEDSVPSALPCAECSE